MNKCFIFALPTRYPNEGQPISIIEAMGSGMFIITTDHAGIPDVVHNGVNGIVMNREATAEKIYEILINLSNNEIKEKSIVNRKECKEKYLQENYLIHMQGVFLKSLDCLRSKL